MAEKLREFAQSELKKVCYEVVQQMQSVIVTTEDEVVKLANKGYDCQILGENKWLMRRKLANGLDSHG